MTTATQPRSARPDDDLSFSLPPGGREKARAGSSPRPDIEGDSHRRPAEPPAPQHPIPSMQDAFAESLFEATKGGRTPKPKLRSGDAKARREELLDQEKSEPPPAATWRYRPGQVNHELRRLMAQISFGVYLLLNGMANSQELVVSILQGHIDEVDEYLETTLEDIDLATKDLTDRISHLKLPMDNMPVFEQMLEDPKFRLQILDGNEKIEHIVARTQIALQQTVQDLAEAVSATREFSIYLAEQGHGLWRRERPDVIDIFDAMKGNTDGWFTAFLDLQGQASTLNAMIVRLNGMVAEMDRKAAEACRRTEFSVDLYSSPHSSPRSSPHHSPRGSDASLSTMRPPSPLVKIPDLPPRLSLRLSTISAMEPAETFFEIRTARQSVIQLRTEPLKQEPAVIESPLEEHEDVVDGEDAPEEVTGAPLLERGAADLEKSQEDEQEQVPESPPARNPRRISERPLPRLEPPQEDKDEAEGTLYILQPRTYTPVPPSPLPSPRVHDYPPRASKEQPKTMAEPAKPARVESIKPERAEPVPPVVKIPAQRSEPASPRVVPGQLRTQTSRPRLVAISARPDQRFSRAPETMLVSPPVPEVPRLSEAGPAPHTETEVLPRQRTSLRQRVSLKTTPPESIQIPPPNAPELQRPVYNQSPRVYQPPDSAYGSDLDRTAVNSMISMTSIDCSLNEFPAPPPRPAMVPSPHSDQQFFRPVQASPHSPLQQRPHTSGTVGPHRQPPPRNIPSAMGMSMLSNVSTATYQSGSSQTLKKKRSAFGWLKKAFSLDDEERAAFEQKRRAQQTGHYFDERSPRFLDGRRIQPRPQQYAESSR